MVSICPARVLGWTPAPGSLEGGPPTPASRWGVPRATRSAPQTPWGLVWSVEPCAAGIQLPPSVQKRLRAFSHSPTVTKCVTHSVAERQEGRGGESAHPVLEGRGSNCGPATRRQSHRGCRCHLSAREPRGRTWAQRRERVQGSVTPPTEPVPGQQGQPGAPCVPANSISIVGGIPELMPVFAARRGAART